MSVYSSLYSGAIPPLQYGVYTAAGVTLTDGAACALQLDVNGNLKTTGGGGGGGGAVTQSTGSGTAAGFWTVQLSNGTNYVGTVGNPLFVQGTVTVNAGTGTMAVSLASLPALAAGTNNIGTVDVVGNAGGIFDAATGASVPANAIQIGDRAATSLPTAVSNGQLVAPMADKFGRIANCGAGPRDITAAQATTITSSTGSTTVVTAGAAGVFTDLTAIAITNSSATALIVTLSDGTASYIYAIAANGGIAQNFPTPRKATSTATAWTLTCGTSVASIYAVIDYVQSK